MGAVIRFLVIFLLASGFPPLAHAQLPGASASAPFSIVRTTAGFVRGVRRDGVHVFKGVRYGASTAGRRFLPPLPVPAWKGVLDALDYGPQSPQMASTPGGVFESWRNPRPDSEDMLSLNVWTPAPGGPSRRPVMVWFHGGGFSLGSGASHASEGTRLAARRDVVVVTVNHRLNALGYLYLAGLSDDPELADAGNVGTLDLVLALQWVRDNIAAFGGDPGNVTIFGQSGGGGKVGALMAMPSAKGLFHKAIVQSGSIPRAYTPTEATAVTEAFLALAGVQTKDVGALRHLPLAKLLAVLQKRHINFGPVLDGRSLPRHPFEPDAPAVSAHVPLLVGNTKDEMAITAGFNRELLDISWEELPKHAARFLQGTDSASAIAELRRIDPKARPVDILFRTGTFRVARLGAILQAERKAALGSAPAFLYQVDWETPVLGGILKSPHSVDVALVFDNVARSRSFYGDADSAQQLADQMSAAWTSFARTGRPAAPGLPAWPPYEAATRPTMLLDTKSRVALDPGRDERLLFWGLPVLAPH